MLRYILPSTSERVRMNTKEKINSRINNTTNENINYYKNTRKDVITSRIEELDHEWDIERVLEANAAIATLITLSLSLRTKQKKWVALSGVISVFLLQHAVQGWCPPLAIFRRMGIRTSTEINEEKLFLKYFRGDFKN